MKTYKVAPREFIEIYGFRRKLKKKKKYIYIVFSRVILYFDEPCGLIKIHKGQSTQRY